MYILILHFNICFNVYCNKNMWLLHKISWTIWGTWVRYQRMSPHFLLPLSPSLISSCISQSLLFFHSSQSKGSPLGFLVPAFSPLLNITVYLRNNSVFQFWFTYKYTSSSWVNKGSLGGILPKQTENYRLFLLSYIIESWKSNYI